MNLFFDNYTFTINGTLAIIAFVVVIVVLLFAIGYSYKLHNQVKQYQKPKYGFLGKPLYPIIALAFMVGTFYVVNVKLPENKQIQIQANDEIGISIDASIFAESNGISNVSIKGIPSISDQEWGNAGDNFDFYWTITEAGRVVETQIETNKTKTNPSGFTKSLKSGSYQIKVVVMYAGDPHEYTQSLNID